METLETPYDTEDDFIECTICEKSLRGDTLYKIHITTPGHLKKEEAAVAAGVAVGRSIPKFKDILHYLEYLKLNEPIIGLDYVEEVSSIDPQGGKCTKYLCKLCYMTVSLPDMVHHLIGRKHRQKYVEIKRPDLVTWDKESVVKQGGMIIRAKSEIIERQDGRGNPKLLPKGLNEQRPNKSKVPPKRWPNRNQSLAHNNNNNNVPAHQQMHRDFVYEYSHQGGFNPDFPDSQPFPPDEPYNNRDRMMYPPKDNFSGNPMEDRYRTDYIGQGYEQGYMGPDNGMNYGDNSQGRGMCGLDDGGARYDSEKMPRRHSQTRHAGHYPEEMPSYRSNPERDPLKEFYSEEVRRQRGHSEYEDSRPMSREDQRQWSLDKEHSRRDNINRANMQDLSEPGRMRSRENDNSSHLLSVIKDYQHQYREQMEEPGSSRNAYTVPQRQLEITKTLSGIPEPFRRFLSGATNDEQQGKRKRKSRFSDATTEEVEFTNRMINEEFGPPNPKSAGPRPETYDSQYDDLYRELQGYHGGGSGGVFDVLKGLEINNADEAEFLKNKLCNLMKEFKARKTETHGGPVFNDYNRVNQDSQSSLPLPYERAPREDVDVRPQRNLGLKRDHRGQGWKQPEYSRNERLQEDDLGPSYRSRYEEVFGGRAMSHTSSASYSDEPGHYPERFEEPRHPRDYRPDPQGYFEPHSTSPPRHMDERLRMNRGTQYSRNLDKITATLLELVGRK